MKEFIGVFRDAEDGSYSFRPITETEYESLFKVQTVRSDSGPEGAFVVADTPFEKTGKIKWKLKGESILYVSCVVINGAAASEITPDVVSDMIVEDAIMKEADVLRIKIEKRSPVAVSLQECDIPVIGSDDKFIYFEVDVPQEAASRDSTDTVKYGHGSHWKCLIEIDDLAGTHLPALLDKGEIEDNVEVTADFFDTGTSSTKPVMTIAYKDPVSGIIIIVNNDGEDSYEFASCYPFIREGENLRLKIREIKEWPNNFEAVIIAETEGGITIPFFDTKYYKNKESYQPGHYYIFSISALAYEVEKIKDRTFLFEGQQAIDWLARIGKKPDYDSKGNVKPVVFDISKNVGFLTDNEEYPDDIEFQSPIYGVEQITAFETGLYKLRIQISCDPDIFINLFAKQDFFTERPMADDPVQGSLWLQGYLIEESDPLIMKNLLVKAIRIAVKAHERQFDKSGMPYICHVMRVMEAGKTIDEKIVGVLHDIVEDTDWTFERLEQEGFPKHITDALRCLTNKPELPYDEFIGRVRTNPLAVRVKINDLTDNMDIRRLSEITPRDVARLQKYMKAYNDLIGIKYE